MKLLYSMPWMKVPLLKLRINSYRNWKPRLKQRDIHLEVSDAVYDQIIKMGVDPIFGARPMKRYIQRNIETEIAKKMIESGLTQDGTIKVDFSKEDNTHEEV